jgi:hypothetical protein
VTLEASVFSNVQAGGNLVSGDATVDFKQTGLLSNRRWLSRVVLY